VAHTGRKTTPTERVAQVKKAGFPVGLLTWILVGLVAGLIARLTLGGGIGGGLTGLVLTVLLGIIGAMVGGFISAAMGWGDVTGFNIRSLVIAAVGAILVLVVWQAISAGRGRRQHA
jgi:uncharacterized membrane protein YeaQ/YmgE (transglycosylase-associated protein family)